jgi:hypothetical protein
MQLASLSVYLTCNGNYYKKECLKRTTNRGLSSTGGMKLAFSGGNLWFKVALGDRPIKLSSSQAVKITQQTLNFKL